MSRPSKFPAEFRAQGCSCIGFRGPHHCGGGPRVGGGTETFHRWVCQDEADRGDASEKPTSAQLAE
jgi:hypothetical protein